MREEEEKKKIDKNNKSTHQLKKKNTKLGLVWQHTALLNVYLVRMKYVLHTKHTIDVELLFFVS